MNFNEMNIDKQILDAIKDLKFTSPTEIQEKSLPPALTGKDVIAQSMTGSGKTLAFAVPMIQNMEHGKGIQAIVLAPTRELANQISEDFRRLGFPCIALCSLIWRSLCCFLARVGCPK